MTAQLAARARRLLQTCWLSRDQRQLVATVEQNLGGGFGACLAHNFCLSNVGSLCVWWFEDTPRLYKYLYYKDIFNLLALCLLVSDVWFGWLFSWMWISGLLCVLPDASTRVLNSALARQVPHASSIFLLYLIIIFVLWCGCKIWALATYQKRFLVNYEQVPSVNLCTNVCIVNVKYQFSSLCVY